MQVIYWSDEVVKSQLTVPLLREECGGKTWSSEQSGCQSGGRTFVNMVVYATAR